MVTYYQLSFLVSTLRQFYRQRMKISVHDMSFENYNFEITATSPRGQWVKSSNNKSKHDICIATIWKEWVVINIRMIRGMFSNFRSPIKGSVAWYDNISDMLSEKGKLDFASKVTTHDTLRKHYMVLYYSIRPCNVSSDYLVKILFVNTWTQVGIFSVMTQKFCHYCACRWPGT